MSPPCDRGLDGTGDADNEPALNGWKDRDGALALLSPSKALEVWIGRDIGADPDGGETDSESMYLALRSAEIGLDPRGGASPWNVDMLP